MSKVCLFIGLSITSSYSEISKCFHKKCRTSFYGYTYCDQERYKCTEYTRYGKTTAGCFYRGYASDDGYVWCTSWQKCITHSYTGQARCEGDYNLDDSVIIAITLVCLCFAAFMTIVASGLWYLRSRDRAERQGMNELHPIEDNETDLGLSVEDSKLLKNDYQPDQCLPSQHSPSSANLPTQCAVQSGLQGEP